MANQDARFIGTIPAMYDRHLGPVLFETHAIDLAQALARGCGEAPFRVELNTLVVSARA